MASFFTGLLSLCEGLGAAIVSNIVQACLLILMASLVVAVLKWQKTSAAARSQVWAVTMLCLASLPLVSPWVAVWELTRMPALAAKPHFSSPALHGAGNSALFAMNSSTPKTFLAAADGSPEQPEQQVAPLADVHSFLPDVAVPVSSSHGHGLTVVSLIGFLAVVGGTLLGWFSLLHLVRRLECSKGTRSGV